MFKQDGAKISDQFLWESYRSGDPAAYTMLIKNYFNPLFRYGIRFIDDDDFVKDCIQDVFLSLWNSRANIGPAASVKSYLFKALRMRIFREKSKWGVAEVLDENYTFMIEFNIENKLIEEQSSEETRLKIINALNLLPKRQKEVLYLRFYESLDHDRIAQVMGVNKQSVYNLLHDAIGHLRKVWFQEVILLLTLCLKNS